MHIQDKSAVKYCYYDLLAAAWMAEKFHMKFEGIIDDWTSMGDFYDDFITLKAPAIIHPDSLHLLEPQEGDKLGDTRSTDRTYTVVADGQNRSYWQIALSGAREFLANGHLNIERRNGLAFHWPKQEDA